MPDEPEIQRLRAAQEQRAEQERRQADQADDAEDRHTHERRADKAAYLRDKLAEQGRKRPTSNPARQRARTVMRPARGAHRKRVFIRSRSAQLHGWRRRGALGQSGHGLCGAG